MKYKTIFSNIIKIIFAFSFFNLIFINVIHAQVPTIFAEGPIISKSGIYNSQKMDSVITPYVNNDSLINDGKKNNWSVGISTSPLIQLHKSGTPFFDFELDKWKLYYRGLLFELNTHYYVNDKISVSLNIGGGYSFYEDLKHSEGPRLMYPVDYPIKIDLYILSYGAGIMYDFYTINEKWKLFGTGNVSLYHSPYGKYEYCTHTEYNKDFIFLAMTANLGCGINYNISNYFSVYIKPNFTIELPVGKSGGIVGMFIYNPNIYFGINYKFNKNEKV